MQLKWTTKALSDLTRLHGFLASVDPQAAARTVQSLVVASADLLLVRRPRAENPPSNNRL